MQSNRAKDAQLVKVLCDGGKFHNAPSSCAFLRLRGDSHIVQPHKDGSKKSDEECLKEDRLLFRVSTKESYLLVCDDTNKIMYTVSFPPGLSGIALGYYHLHKCFHAAFGDAVHASVVVQLMHGDTEEWKPLEQEERLVSIPISCHWTSGREKFKQTNLKAQSVGGQACLDALLARWDLEANAPRDPKAQSVGGQICLDALLDYWKTNAPRLPEKESAHPDDTELETENNKE